MDSADNPARRLHTLYAAFEKNGGRGTDSNNKTTARTAWASALGLDEKADLPELLAQFGVIVGLPTEVRGRITELPDTENQELLSSHLPKFEQVFSTRGLHGMVRDYRKVIGPHELESLLHISDALQRDGAREVVLDQDELARLHEQIAALFEEVREADLEDELQRFILRHLERIERALRRVQVEGVQGLQEALTVLGAEVIVESHSDSSGRLRAFMERAGTVGNKLSSLANHILVTIRLAEYAPAIANTVQRMLPSG